MKSVYKTRLIQVPMAIEASARYCSNNCTHLVVTHTPLGYEAQCRLFDVDGLRWDPRKKEHGYERVLACKDAEKEARAPLSGEEIKDMMKTSAKGAAELDRKMKPLFKSSGHK